FPEPDVSYESATYETPIHAAPAETTDYRLRFRELLHQDNDGEFSVVDSLCREQTAPEQTSRNVLAVIRQQLHTAGVDEITAAAWLAQLDDVVAARPNLALRDAQEQLLRIVEAEIPLCGELQLPAGERRVVALVGPTGVGKTTTVAKL